MGCATWQRKPVTQVCCPWSQTDSRDVTTSRDHISSSCHHSSNQIDIGKVDMAGPKHEVFVLASTQLEGAHPTVTELPTPDTICDTQLHPKGELLTPKYWLYSQWNPSGLWTQGPLVWSIHSPSARGSRVWIMSWTMVPRIWELCREAELLPRCRPGPGCGEAQSQSVPASLFSASDKASPGHGAAIQQQQCSVFAMGKDRPRQPLLWQPRKKFSHETR